MNRLVLSLALLAPFSSVVAIDCGQYFLGWYKTNQNSHLDPQDGDSLQLQVQPGGCNTYNSGSNEAYIAQVTYTGQSDGVLSSTSISATITASPTGDVLTYQFTGLPLVNMGLGVPITIMYGQSVINADASYAFGPALTLNQISTQSIFYTVTTSTYTVTTGTDSYTTTDVTNTATSTFTPVETDPSTVGTSTVEAPTPTSTATSTVTPRHKVITVLEETVITTHLTCLPTTVRPVSSSTSSSSSSTSAPPPPAAAVEQAHAKGPCAPRLFKRAVEMFESPNFSAVVPTTYTTNTFLSVVTQTTTNTLTNTNTDSTTVTVTGPTSTAYSSVTATTTTTPSPSTVTTTTTLVRRTVHRTTTLIIHRTIMPKHLPKCKPTASSKFAHAKLFAANVESPLHMGPPEP